jgi:hypothetical protein
MKNCARLKRSSQQAALKRWTGKREKRSYEDVLNEGQGSSPALNDLAAGCHFYDRHQRGIGDYFFDSLFTDIDSLTLYARIHRAEFGFIEC